MAELAHRLRPRLEACAGRALTLLFYPDDRRLSRWMGRALSALMWLGGAVVWGFVLDWGRIGFDVHDWTQEGPRYAFLRQALLEGRLPLHIGSALASTTRFLSIPDTLISPQIVLLRWMEPGPFVLLNVLFLYSLGFLGLVLLARKLKASPFTFLVMFLLVMLNGHPVAQIAVSHTMWAAYFLLPYFALLLLELGQGLVGWGWVVRMALPQFGLDLQGGFHFVNWCLMFLLLWGLTWRPALAPLLKAIAASLLVGMVRILPAALEFGATERSFISGYFSVTDLVRGFIELRPPQQALTGLNASLGWWEVDAYTGLLGFGFLVVCGIYLTARDTVAGGRSLLPPVLLLTVLSLGKFYQPVTWLPLPLVTAERVSSRFIIVPMVLTVILGGVAFERWLQGRRLRTGHILLLLTLGVVAAHDLLQHARLWRIENMQLLFPLMSVDIRAQVLTLSDPPYEASLIVGLLASAFAFAGLIGLAARERRLAAVKRGG
ncbi:MAG: hypothetical protein AB1449_00145 [Chloroflexota bacterium]